LCVHDKASILPFLDSFEFEGFALVSLAPGENSPPLLAGFQLRCDQTHFIHA
jgi:hypothetical protein